MDSKFIFWWCFVVLLLMPTIWLIIKWYSRTVNIPVQNSILGTFFVAKINAIIFSVAVGIAIVQLLFWTVAGSFFVLKLITNPNVEFFYKWVSLKTFFILWLIGCFTSMETNILFLKRGIMHLLFGLVYTVIACLIVAGMRSFSAGYKFHSTVFWTCSCGLVFLFRYRFFWKKGI